MLTMEFKRTKFTCFYANLAMSSAFSLPPILFATFHDLYGISYTLLGTLVLVNFCTQLIVDLLFSFFSKHFNIPPIIRNMPLLTAFGLGIYALVPYFFPQYTYAGLVAGTVIFSVAAGLAEVLMNPLVAALPSDNPDRDMSALHSLYAYGVFTVCVISALFIWVFGRENWVYLTLFWAVLPVIASVLFHLSAMPEMNLSHNEEKGEKAKRKSVGLALCAICIFLGGATEMTMTNWVSAYMEQALLIPKVVGDILGTAAFAVLLGLTRTWYAKRGKNIYNVLFVSMLGSIFCYLTVGLSGNVMISVIACALTGIFTAMLWPGILIYMEEKIPHAGVAAYALMAAGGDFGASIAPQGMGVVVDNVSISAWGENLAASLHVPVEQIGMKVGMLLTAVFPILGVAVLLLLKRHFKTKPNMRCEE